MDSTDTVAVSVDVKNTGDRDGDEVVQLYVEDLTAKVPYPIEALKGFDRVSIPKGETRTVTISLPVKSLEAYSPKEGKLVVAPGNYELRIGSSSKDIKFTKSITVE